VSTIRNTAFPLKKRAWHQRCNIIGVEIILGFKRWW
jgi:hypothetical protein